MEQLSKQLDKELRGKKVEKKRVMGIEPSFDVLTKLEVSNKYLRRSGIACHLYSPCALTLHNQPLNEMCCPVVSCEFWISCSIDVDDVTLVFH